MIIREATRLVDCFNVLPFVRGLDSFYPDITEWFVNKAIPGIVVGSDICLIAEDGNNVCGVVLAKNTIAEKKLRCVRVVPSYVGRGLGYKLIERAIYKLGNETPIASVAEEKINDYSRLLVNGFGFKLTGVEKGVYRRGKLEYVFNGADIRSKTSY